MNKKNVTISLICLFLLAISLTIILVFFVFKDRKDLSLKTKDVLTIYVDDISLSIGKKIYDYYEISDKSAEITFDVDKQGIIEIDETMIEGVSAGTVNVIMTAKTQKETTKVDFVVKVYENDYTFNFLALSNCSFENDNILITSSVFQFNIEIKDKLNNKLENVVCEILSNKTSTIIDRGFSAVLVVANEECILTFTFPELSTSFSKKVVFL